MDTLPLFPDDGKKCSKCNAVKPCSEFYFKRKQLGQLFSWCKACHAAITKANNLRDPARCTERSMAWQKANPERVLASRKKSRAKDRESRLAKQKVYIAKNRDALLAHRKEVRKLASFKAKAKAYREKMKVQILVANKKYYEANKPAAFARGKLCKLKNPILYRRIHQAAHARRKARKMSLPVESFKNVEIFERDSWICHICGKPVNRDLTYPDQMCASLDHVKPFVAGGGHTRDNVACSHLKCNIIKRDRYE